MTVPVTTAKMPGIRTTGSGLGMSFSMAITAVTLRSIAPSTSGGGRAVGLTARQAIHGLGGVGKTRLAIEYAWRHASDYTALLFISARSAANLRFRFMRIAAIQPLEGSR
jgi:hypothetical protein